MDSRYFQLEGVLASLTFLMFSLVLSTSSLAADTPRLQISSPAIPEGASIPLKFSCGGENQPPPLSWTGVPPGTKSLVLILGDPDAPIGTFVHWIVYDIPPSSNGLKTGDIEGKEGKNTMGKAAYMGPCPPPGSQHHYHFELFALDTNLDLAPAPDAQMVRDAMKGHIKDSAELVGIFSR